MRWWRQATRAAHGGDTRSGVKEEVHGHGKVGCRWQTSRDVECMRNSSSKAMIIYSGKAAMPHERLQKGRKDTHVGVG